MYEKRQGTLRLVNALNNISEDEAKLNFIASATNYLQEQLKEDIKALYDYVKEVEEEREDK